MQGFGYIPITTIWKWCELRNIFDIQNISFVVKCIRALEETDQELSNNP